MADILNNNDQPIEEEAGVYTLTDLETGEERDFELMAEAELDGNLYMAFAPVAEDAEEYTILRAVPVEDGEEGDLELVNIEDDDEFDRVAAHFDDLLFGEVDYDAEGADEE